MVLVRGAGQESCLLRCVLISSSTSSSGSHDRSWNVRMHKMEGCLVSLKLVDSQLPWLDKCKKWVTADCLVTGSQGCSGGSKETHCRGAVWCGRGRASPLCPSRLQHPVSWLEDLTFACYFGASEMLSCRLGHVINSHDDSTPCI